MIITRTRYLKLLTVLTFILCIIVFIWNVRLLRERNERLAKQREQEEFRKEEQLIRTIRIVLDAWDTNLHKTKPETPEK